MIREAEALLLSDLSRRITAKEMAERFGISESSFKFYVKGILGERYLACFRKKRMEKAAELLESTNQRSGKSKAFYDRILSSHDDLAFENHRRMESGIGLSQSVPTVRSHTTFSAHAVAGGGCNAEQLPLR